MSLLRTRVRRDERGAALILAIAFMVVIGGIGAAVTSSVTSGLNDRQALDQARNREYAADAAIETAISQVRNSLTSPGAVAGECAPAPPYTLNGFDVRVDCDNAPAVVRSPTALVLQNDVIFTVCIDTPNPCRDEDVIIRAQVNFQGTGTPTQVKTYVQAWSVNG